jgi:hypothetical protein
MTWRKSKHILYSTIFFPKIEIMWKMLKSQRSRTVDVTRHMPFACWMIKATDTRTYLVFSRGSNGYMNAPQCHFICTLPDLPYSKLCRYYWNIQSACCWRMCSYNFGFGFVIVIWREFSTIELCSSGHRENFWMKLKYTYEKETTWRPQLKKSLNVSTIQHQKHKTICTHTLGQ